MAVHRAVEIAPPPAESVRKTVSNELTISMGKQTRPRNLIYSRVSTGSTAPLSL